ncbi:FAD-binding oxidoreductase [Candidatus Saccharibacteria bacterium TM7i]|nr:FAD-binding oxidoreductase [Candidatus Saccharibacteria bacterium TM7i]
MRGQLYSLMTNPDFNGVVETTQAAREAVKRDASIFEVVPTGVIAPRDVNDIQAAVRWASEEVEAGRPVTLAARVGGTCMSGGSLTEGYVLDLKRFFNFTGQVDPAARTIRTQSGAMHLTIEKAAKKAGLLFASYTSSREICGIGGMLGNNASGEQSIKYGPTSANVNNVKVVLSDGNEYEFGPLSRAEVEDKKRQPTFEGEIYRRMTDLLDKNSFTIDRNHPRTVKNAAGYQLWDLWDAHKQTLNLGRLFIGAQGTLGVITEAELKLVKPGSHRRMIVTPIKDLDKLAEVVKTMLAEGPAICETFDHFTYELAEKYYPQDADRAHVARGKHMVVFSIFEGETQDQADIIAGAAKEALEHKGHDTFWIDEKEVIESFLLIRRKSFGMLLEHPTPNTRAEAFLEDTIVPLEHYGDFLRELEAILEEYKLIYTYAGHIGHGSIRLIPLVDMEAPGAAETVMELESKVNDLVIRYGGSISVDHNDGIIRTPFLEKQFGTEMTKLFEEVKNIFDPLNIFNAGKKVGGTYEYAVEHIIRENVNS